MLAFALHALVISWCAFFLAPAHTEDGAGGWSHRTLLLVLLVVCNASVCVMVWATPKRQVFLQSMVSSFLYVLMAADAVWKCVHVFVSVKIAGVLLCLGVLAVMRKLAARMQVAGASGGIKAAQLTRAQKIIILGLALNSVGYVIAPGWNLWAVTEIMLCTSMIMEGWTHFIAFERTVKDTFGEMAQSIALTFF